MYFHEYQEWKPGSPSELVSNVTFVRRQDIADHALITLHSSPQVNSYKKNIVSGLFRN